jgi:hypothetical protein
MKENSRKNDTNQDRKMAIRTAPVFELQIAG